ncbi:hypothetical protein [Aestuariivirga litoralis]|uniref:hypothetical protein n=1 Tax=Aestuariivirga litoralis TaxID=2650924 RepID=UPI0018C4A5F5|nr:hypothetical protein [Aestuariivirga litoralis]MBG1232111.1 hypothetical protein [Aestuariivirga litoralis]
MKEPKIPQATKAAMTDSAAKFIIESERIQIAKKMEKLKQARLEMAANAPPVAVVAKPAKRARVAKAS